MLIHIQLAHLLTISLDKCQRYLLIDHSLLPGSPCSPGRCTASFDLWFAAGLQIA